MGFKESDLSSNKSDTMFKQWRANNCQPNFRVASFFFQMIVLVCFLDVDVYHWVTSAITNHGNFGLTLAETSSIFIITLRISL